MRQAVPQAVLARPRQVAGAASPGCPLAKSERCWSSPSRFWHRLRQLWQTRDRHYGAVVEEGW